MMEEIERMNDGRERDGKMRGIRRLVVTLFCFMILISCV